VLPLIGKRNGSGTAMPKRTVGTRNDREQGRRVSCEGGERRIEERTLDMLLLNTVLLFDENL